MTPSDPTKAPYHELIREHQVMRQALNAIAEGYSDRPERVAAKVIEIIPARNAHGEVTEI